MKINFSSSDAVHFISIMNIFVNYLFYTKHINEICLEIIVLKCVCLYWSVYSNQFKATSKPNNKTNCKCTSCVYTNHYVFDLNPSFVFLFLMLIFSWLLKGSETLCSFSRSQFISLDTNSKLISKWRMSRD